MLSHDLIHLLSAIFALEYTGLHNLLIVLVLAFIVQKVMLSWFQCQIATSFQRSVFLLIRKIDGSR